MDLTNRPRHDRLPHDMDMDGNARVHIKQNGTSIGTRRTINLVAGAGIVIDSVDSTAGEEVTVTISATGTTTLPPGWSPLSLAPLIWLDAQVDSSITEAGGVVTDWADQTVHGNDVTQGTAGSRPTKDSTAINGHQGIDFTGNKFLSKIGFPVTQPFTVLAVAQLTAFGTDYEAVFDFGLQPTTFGVQLTTDFGGTDRWHFNAGGVALSSIDPDLTAHAIGAVFADTVSALWWDGVNTDGNLASGSSSAIDIRLGGTNDGALSDVIIGEFVVVPASVSSDDMAAWFAYAHAKWGTTNTQNSLGTPVITTANPGGGTVNNVYGNYQFVATGNSPITWTVAAGTLPTSMTLSTAGVLSGTPTVAGTYQFTVTATNSLGSATSSLITIVIAAASATAPTITSTPVHGGTQNVAYSSVTFLATGTTPITWAVQTGSLPTGLSLSSAGVLSGTPTGTGTSTFTVRATNGTGHADSASLSISIVAVGTRQHVTYWTGTVGLDDIIGGVGGLDLSAMYARGFRGLQASLGTFSNPSAFPSWLIGEWQQALAGLGSFWAGYKITDSYFPFPTDNATVDAMISQYWAPLINILAGIGATGIAMDCEPYGLGADDNSVNPWCLTSQSVATYYGAQLGALVHARGMSTQIYPSSNASFPGSNNDEIQTQNLNPNHYAPSKFKYFIQALITAGANVNLVDASFQSHGIQNTNYNTSYQDAATAVATLTSAPFTGTIRSSGMNWYWDIESGGNWPHDGEVQDSVEAWTTYGTGEYMVYDGNRDSNFTYSEVFQWFDETKAGSGT